MDGSALTVCGAMLQSIETKSVGEHPFAAFHGIVAPIPRTASGARAGYPDVEARIISVGSSRTLRGRRGACLFLSRRSSRSTAMVPIPAAGR